MRGAFDLLTTAVEPTIADFPVDAPDEVGPEEWACPLNLVREPDASLTGRLLSEVGRLAPWSTETRTARGRTLFGATGAAPDQVAVVARMLAAVVDLDEITDLPQVEGGNDVDWAFEMPLLIRHLADDLRTHYHEALAAQPGGGSPNHDALNAWIFGGTALGDTLQAVADRLTVADDPMASLVRGLLIPEGHYQGGSAF